MTAIIYHNPRCSKSRAALDILKQKGVDFKIVEYLKNPPSTTEMKALLSGLGMRAHEIVRPREYREYRAQNPNIEAADEAALIRLMIENPKLIERPIVRTEKGVALGRPPENILGIL